MSQAGKFRERVTFFAPGQTVSDGAGGRLPAAAETSVTHWARVQALPAKEDLINGKVSYRQPYKLTIRYIEGIDNSTRLTWNNQDMSIASAVANERRTEISFYCIAHR